MDRMLAIRDEVRAHLNVGSLGEDADENFRSVYEDALEPGETLVRVRDEVVELLLETAAVEEETVQRYIATMQTVDQSRDDEESRGEMELMLRAFAPERRADRPILNFAEFLYLIHICTLLADVG